MSEATRLEGLVVLEILAKGLIESWSLPFILDSRRNKEIFTPVEQHLLTF